MDVKPKLTQKLPNGSSFDLLYVEGGHFQMGSTDEEAYEDEQPVHEVQVSAFYFGQFPVTQALWLAVMGGENPAYFPADKRPVESVSWYDVLVFCNQLSVLAGYTPRYYSDEAFQQVFGQTEAGFSLPEEDVDFTVYFRPGVIGYRLPSEAEWEYAARGGNLSENYRYAGGNDLDKLGWYDDNSHGETKEVGLKLPNELGLYDLSGNVYEWCEDHRHENYEGAPDNGSPWLNEIQQNSSRVFRGGSWNDYAQGCRSTYRYNYHPALRILNVGFRVVLFFPPGSWSAHSKQLP
jgi:formylglycine-generating enzyme required for sulfatase activity